MNELLKHFSIPVFPWGKNPPSLNDIVRLSRHVETLGFYSVNTPLINTLAARSGGAFGRFDNRYTLDALSMLPAMVAVTENIRVAVDGVPLFQLPPFGWAKYFSSLDVLSKGRVIMGACLGFGEEAFQTVGMKQIHRGRIADEQLEVVTRLFTEDNVTHEGRFYQLYDVTVDPKPIQKPYPPIWIGGRERSMPRAGRYADCLDVPWPSVKEAREIFVPGLKKESQKWDRHTKLGGWYYARVSTGAGDVTDVDAWFGGLMNQEFDVKPSDLAIAGSAAQCASLVREYLDAGVEHFVLDFQRHGLENIETVIEQTTLFAEEVVPLI